MRIGIFTNVYKPEISGVPRSISTFRDELIRQGHQVYIFAPEAPNYEEEDYDVFRYPGIRMGASLNYPMAIPVSPYIDWLVPRLRLDILHSQHPVLLGEEAINFAKKHNIPHVFTHHTQYEEYSHYIPFNQNIVKTLTREVVRMFLLRCVSVITPTQSIKDQLSKTYPEVKERFRVLPTPIFLERFAADKLNPGPVRQKYKLDGTFTFAAIARLTPEKSFDNLIKAFAQVEKKHPQARLMIIGDGSAKKDLMELAESLNLKAKVIFTGAIPYDDVPHHLSAADVFAFSSTSETQGIVLIEAMAVGLPVVAVDAPGNRDVTETGVNGILTKNSIGALAEGMEKMLLNPDLCVQYKEGALKTAAGFSTEAMGKRLLNIYEEAISIYKKSPLDYKRFSKGDKEEPRTYPPKWLSEITGENAWLDSLVSFWKK